MEIKEQSRIVKKEIFPGFITMFISTFEQVLTEFCASYIYIFLYTCICIYTPIYIDIYTYTYICCISQYASIIRPEAPFCSCHNYVLVIYCRGLLLPTLHLLPPACVLAGPHLLYSTKCMGGRPYICTCVRLHMKSAYPKCDKHYSKIKGFHMYVNPKLVHCV